MTSVNTRATEVICARLRLRNRQATAELRQGAPRPGAAAPAGRVRIAPRLPLRPTRPSGHRRPALRPLLLAGALLAGVAALLLSLASGAHGDARVLVAARGLPAGTLLSTGDLRSVEIAAGGALVATLVAAGQEPRILGETLSAPLQAGEPLPRSALAAGGDPAAFTLTVGAEHALGGALRPGDRVSVLATFETPSGGASARVLARGLVVLAVGQPPSIGDPSQATIPVTVALPEVALAPALALANTVGHVDLLRDGALAPSSALAAASLPGAAA